VGDGRGSGVMCEGGDRGVEGCGWVCGRGVGGEGGGGGVGGRRGWGGGGGGGGGGRMVGEGRSGGRKGEDINFGIIHKLKVHEEECKLLFEN